MSLRGVRAVLTAAAVLGWGLPSGADPGDYAAPDALDAQTRAAQVVFAPAPLRGPIHQAGVLVAGPELGDLSVLHDEIERWRSRAPLPVLVAADAELGLLHRLRGHPALPPIPSRPHRRSEVEIEALGYQAGVVLRDVGIDLVFAPVADVAATGHLARHRRTAGADPARVIEVALAYNRGLQRAGLLTVAKHYPGYGNTPHSSDSRAVRVPQSVIDEHEPVFRAIAPHVDGLMFANLAYGDDPPAVTSPDRVAAGAALSPVLFTDDVFAMRATWKRKKIAGDAFTAGIHVLVSTAPLDWQPHPHGGAVPRWISEDPSVEIASLVRDSPHAKLLLDAHVCAVWELMARVGRRAQRCGPGE